MSSKSELQTKLDKLISDADAQTRLHESSRALLYRTLAGVYLWWREAKKIDGYLDELYKGRNLVARGDEEKFTRLIRLVWQMNWDNRKYPTLQLWSNAVRAIHSEFESNNDAYAVDPQAKLKEFISNKGGIRGMLGITDRDELLPVENEQKGNKKRSKTDLINDQKLLEKHFELGVNHFAANAPSLTNIVSKTRQFAMTNEGFAVALVKRGENSEYKILRVTNDGDLVKKTIIETYKRKPDAAPYVLRLIGEVIETQSLPLALERHRASLSGVSDVLASDGKTKLKQLKRLLFRPKSKDILLSESRSDCSVVTIATPHQFPVTTDENLLLRTSSNRYIENEIVQKRDMSFFTTFTKRIQSVTNPELKASHSLTTKNSVTGKIRNLYFYKLSSLAEGSQIQAVVNKSATTAPVWRATADKDWVDALYALFVSNWLTAHGANINRPDHKQVLFELSKNGILIRHYGHNGAYTATEDRVPAPAIASGSKSCAIHLLSKDIFPVLNALAHQDIIGKVQLMANTDMLAIQYETEVAKYSIAVPSCSKNGKRTKTAFVAMGV